MHAYKIAVAKGLEPYRTPKRIPSVKVIKPEKEQAKDRKPGRIWRATHKPSYDDTLTSKTSSAEEVFSTPSNKSRSTKRSTPPPTYDVEQSKRNTLATVLDRFSLDLAQSNTLQLNAEKQFWMRKRQAMETLGMESVEFFFPAMFRSLRICTTEMVGQPVHLMSEYTIPLGPRGLKVGEALFLNRPGSGDDECHLSTQPGDSGRPRFILEYTCRLLEETGGRTKFTMEASMDITEMMRTLCESLFAKYYGPHSEKSGQAPNSSQRYKDKDFMIQGIDWEEHAQHEYLATLDPELQRTKATADLDIPVNDPDLIEFHERVEDIKFFHRDCFILEKGDGAQQVWKISRVSSSLYKALSDVHIGMASTPSDTLHELGRGLAGDQPVTLDILWGSNADRRRIYCVPMFRTQQTCWLCFLTSSGGGDLFKLFNSRRFLQSWKD